MSYIKAIWSGSYNFGKKHYKGIGAVAIAAALFVCGWLACQHFGKNVVTKTDYKTVTVTKEIPIEVPVEVKGDTEIRYIEKESPADADVQISNPAPVVSVSYNGEKTELAGVSSESQKFDKGKLVVEQKSEATLDVTPIVDREVNMAVDKQKAEDKAALDEAVQDEKHNAHKHGQKTFLYGLGVGLLGALAF